MLTGSQARTRNFIIGVGIAAVLFGLGLSWLIGRSITGPLNGLAAVMKHLADGDTSAKIPATRQQDEIGGMARTVIVFRDNMIEREKLAASQGEEGRAREARAEAIAAPSNGSRNRSTTCSAKCAAPRNGWRRPPASSTRPPTRCRRKPRNAESRVGAASENVTSAAGSVEELASSISEIAAQANKSTEVARRAVEESRRTTTTMSELGNAATRIGEVVSLIQAIAGQTNLLALECHDRGGARRRSRPRLRGGRAGSQIARRADRESDRRDRGPDRRHPVGRGGRRACVAAGQRHHRGHVDHCRERRHHGRGAEFRREPDFGRRPARPRPNRAAAPKP